MSMCEASLSASTSSICLFVDLTVAPNPTLTIITSIFTESIPVILFVRCCLSLIESANIALLPVSDLFAKCKQGILSCHSFPTGFGEGGSYFVKSASSTLAVLKPADEEPYSLGNDRNAQNSKQVPLGSISPLRSGFHVGLSFLREAVAYLIDATQSNSAGVPHTGIVELPPLCSSATGEEIELYPRFLSFEEYSKAAKAIQSSQGARFASLQCFVDSVDTAEDLGSGIFSLENVQRIAVFDIRLLNCDRHLGNLLVTRSNGVYKLTPIDHGFVLPRIRCIDVIWDWINWPQLKEPICDEVREEIVKINIDRDSRLLLEAGIEADAVLGMRLSAWLLQKGVEKSLCLWDIAQWFDRGGSLDEPSTFEVCIRDACDESLLDRMMSEDGIVDAEELFQLELRSREILLHRLNLQ